MTKKALRFLIIVLTAALIFSVALYWIDRISQTTYTAAEMTSPHLNAAETRTFTDDDTLSLLSSVIRNSDYVDDQSVTDGLTPDLRLTVLSKNGDRVNYEVYVSSVFKRTAYLKRTSDRRVTKMDTADFTEFFSSAAFSDALSNTTPLKAYLISQSTEEVSSLAVVGHPYSGTWNYAGADGKQLTYEVTGEDRNEYALIENNPLPFTLHMSDIPTELMNLTVYEDGEAIIQLLTDGTNIPNPGKDGFYVYEITASWPTVADVDYNGRVTYRFYVDIDLAPAPQLSLSSAPQGSVVSVKAANGDKDDTVTASCEALEWTGNFTAVNGVPTALMAVPLSAKAGEYEIEFNINGESYTEIFTVTDGNFPSRQLSMSTSVSKSWTSEQETYLTPLRQYVSAQNYINGVFTEPTTGDVTTDFGTFLYAKGAIEPTRHNGIDIADGTAPSVVAPMNGVVVFTMNMKLTGKTVVIDHGMNVLSYFYHLNTVEVEEGDFLSAGDLIGQMGATGNAKGVHLHYTVMVNGCAVDPNVFYNTDFSK